MSEKTWSTYIQATEMLYRTRNIRFRNEFKEQYLKVLDLRDGTDILEIGCGPGLLCHRLKEWLPESRITGIDKDECHGQAYKKSINSN